MYKNNLENINSPEDIKKSFNKLMNDTPIKLACCSRNNPNNNNALKLNARVPLSPNIANTNPTLKSYNFQNENINIPANSCSANLTPYSSLSFAL